MSFSEALFRVDSDTLNAITTKMNRYDFEPVLARLVLETSSHVAKKQNGVPKTSSNSLMSNTLSYIKRFINIDHAWTPDRITRLLENCQTQHMDVQIAKYQKDIDDNPPEPGASRKKEIGKEKVRDFALTALSPLLAARALRQLEHDLDLVEEDGIKYRQSDSYNSIDPQYPPDTPFHQDRLAEARKKRLKEEKLQATEAVNICLDRAVAAREGKKIEGGHWEFENVEEETLARTFMRRNREGQSTGVSANDVLNEQMDPASASVILEVRLKWIEGNEDDVERSTNKTPKIEPAMAKKGRSTDGRSEEQPSTVSRALPKKSLIVKLPVDFSRLKMKKRKQSQSSDATSSPKMKKQKTATTEAVEPKAHQLREEIQKLTLQRMREPDNHYLGEEVQNLSVQWMRQIYQDPAMSHPGFKDGHTVADDVEMEDLSDLSEAPESD